MNLDIFLTTDCNMRCDFCGAWKQDKLGQYLSKDKVFKMLDQGKKYGFKFTTLSGGEPLMHPDIGEIINYADSLGYWVNITTNGLLIDDKFIESLRNKKANLRVSCHTLQREKHNNVTGTDSFEKLMQSVELLKKRRVYYSMGSTIHEDNMDEMENLTDFAFKQGAAFIRFTPVARVFKGKGYNLDQRFYEDMISRIMELDIKYKRYLNYRKPKVRIMGNPVDIMATKRCAAGSNLFMIIDSNEELVPCQFIPEDRGYPRCGYRGEMDFKKLREGMEERFTRAQEKGYKGRCGECSFLSVCYGGCLGNKLPNGLDLEDEQPICIREVLNNSISGFETKDVEEIVDYWFYHFNKRVSREARNLNCMRKLPIWEVNFKHAISRE